MLKFKCTACRKQIITDDSLSGQEGQCPYCKQLIRAPGQPVEVGGPPKTRAMDFAMAKTADRRKVMLLSALVVVGLIVAGVRFVGGDDVPRYAPDEKCRRQMLGMMDNAWTYPGGIPKSTGSQFWIEVAEKRNVAAGLKCPSGADKGRRCDYRGPAKPLSQLTENDIVMTCMPGNHPGGVNILSRSGGINWAPDGSDLFKKALSQTKE